jgi:hypothetical protein
MAQGPLEQLIRVGEVTGKTFVWCEGMAEWRRAEVLPDLMPFLRATQAPRPANTADLSQLFSDLDLAVSRPMDSRAVEQMLAGTLRPKTALPSITTTTHVRSAAHRARVDDPDDDELDTGFIRRNRRWKVAAALLLVLALPVAGLYALSSLQVLPLEVTRVDEVTGAQVKDPVFSTKGVRGLKNLLLGSTTPPAPPREPPPRPRPAAVAKPSPPPPPEAKPVAEAKASPELKALYADPKKQDVGPGPAPSPSRSATTAAAPGGGPSPQALSKVVSQGGPSFQFCIEQQLKKTPKFRGGKVNLVATVGPSGVVKQARLDRKDIDLSDLGDCLKSKARRLVFPAFHGEDVEVQIPLVLTATL